VKQINEQLSAKFSQLEQKRGIYTALFGGDVTTATGAFARVGEILKSVTVNGN